MERKYTRVDTVRKYVDAMLLKNPDPRDRRNGYVHLYGVGMAAALIAMKRGHDRAYAELAEIAGMLHDYTAYHGADGPNHAHECAPVIRALLVDSGAFSPAEIDLLADAVYRHGDKEVVDGEFAEILKDADVLQHWLRNPNEDFWYHRPRAARLVAELGLTI